MAQQNNSAEFLDAWRALADSTEVHGWRTISIANPGICRFKAGRHFPGNGEALLVGFSSLKQPLANELPQGNGFVVSTADLRHESDGHTWLALSRQDPGDLTLFTMMAEDVVKALGKNQDANADVNYRNFLARIRAWQNFMQKGESHVLSPEAEIGLWGELDLMQTMLFEGLSPLGTVEAWEGPLDGLQDFALGAGAIEVKTTASASGFVATIASLEQLDDSFVQPIFLAGVRLNSAADGQTLSEKVDAVRQLVAADITASQALDSRLIHAGFLPALSDRYVRRFRRSDLRVFPISATFPRLFRGNVPGEVRSAIYRIDLDTVSVSYIKLIDALQLLGVTK